jgi:hypothetical protein
MTALMPIVVTLVGAAELADPWQRGFTGAEAAAPHVIALWQFTSGAELADSSGHGHELELHGAKPAREGRFGGGLESFPGWPVEDKRHAAVAKAHPALSPSGAFSIDLWLKPGANLPAKGNCHLLCKKYVSHNDYQLLLGPAERSGRRLQLVLGFGSDSESFASDAVEWPASVWQHVAVTYDGAGTVRFYRNGASFGGRTVPGRGSIVPGRLPLSIGDRTGSHYGGFAGVLDEIRISKGVREFSPVKLALFIERTAYVRMEPAPKLSITISNRLPDALQDARLTVTGAGAARELKVPPLAAGTSHTATIPFDTALRPDVYELRARLDVPGSPAVTCFESIQLTLTPRPLPHRMPVVMWGIGGPEPFQRELGRLKDLGFTHCLGIGADYASIWNAGRPVPPTSPERIAETRRMLDTALANGIGIAAQLSPGHYLKSREELRRVGRDGKPYARSDVNAALPGLAEFCTNVGASVAQTYGTHPALQAALINTEVRDDAQVSFSKFDRDAYRQFSGREIPAEVGIKNGVTWQSLKDFPADRVIPDDHPILAFYRWYWTVGDGWNGLHSAVHRGLMSTGRADLWTWFDPAIRVPSIAGSGGAVDVLGQWTYTDSSPLRVGYFADELLAMAALAKEPQRVMKMTQLFWYRSTSAPIGTKGNRIASPFDDHDPDAAYISIAPMHLRESFWTKLSRPVAGLMYHGWSALVPTDGTHAYKHTQPDTQTEFRRLHREVLEPLGPTLLQVSEHTSDVAYLDSFTSQMFARRGSYGYSHDEAYLTLLHAQLQPQVVFEETILRRGLEGYRVLVLIDCDVLPASVAGRISEFQKRGGLIIGDPNLAPAVKPDVTIPRFTRTKQAAADKATILANAARLRAALDARYRRPAECTNPEIVTRIRSVGAAHYVFVVNDRREAGTYVGQHGLVQEIGLPGEGEVRLRRSKGHVYDLCTGRAVPAVRRDDTLTWPVQLAPCDGRVFLVTDRPIAGLAVQVPEEIVRGKACACQVHVTDPAGRPIDAVIPVRIDVLDPHGRPAEITGYYGARGGKLDPVFDIATNDAPGTWTIRATELATGQSASRYVRVRP